MTSSIQIIRKEWAIVIVLILSFILRIWGLTYQSLWLDELHNMNEADPDITWGAMFNHLKCCDQHPPLYFIVERLAFTFFGHTEFVARIISVIAGTASVWALWFLGKEILNRSLGLIAAVITSINYYNLFYSQEARGYIFLFLFAALSFAYLIRLIKAPDRKNAVMHAVFSLCLLYSHYYSLFAMVAQGILALLFLVFESLPARKRLFNMFVLSSVIIVIGYLPWLPFLSAMSKIESFWISDISPGFIGNFFYDYFGNADLLKPFLILFILVYIFHITLNAQISETKMIKNNPALLSFAVFVLWIFVTYLIPYVRSLLVVPMLFPRYTIVVLPAIIISLAYGIELFKVPLLKYLVLGIFVTFSLVDIILVKKFYTDIRKTQFREMTQYVVKENPSNFPIINQVTAWHQQYYLKRFKSMAPVFSGPKDALVDSIMGKHPPKWNLNGFWIVGAHGDKVLDEVKLKELSETYILLKQKTFSDAWAQLFINKSMQSGDYRVIRFNDFAANEGTLVPEDNQIALWGGAIHTNPVSIDSGKYDLTITAMGTPAQKVFPHLNIYCNDQKVGDYHVASTMTESTFRFENPRKGMAVFKIELDNDLVIPGDGDRNAFLRQIVLTKSKN